MSLSIIVAHSRNGVIGRDGTMPWHLSSDLRRFRSLTMGKTIIMGHRTHEAIGRSLPGRKNLVLSRDPSLRLPGCTVCNDWEQIRSDYAGPGQEGMVIGGRQIYTLALPDTIRIYLSEVIVELEGDIHFPQPDWRKWHMLERSFHPAEPNDDYDHIFSIWEHRSLDTARLRPRLQQHEPARRTKPPRSHGGPHG